MRVDRFGDATLYTADVFEALHELAKESVNTVVTSPPYFGLRDYGVEGQIGLEDTLQEYLAKLVVVFNLVRRVLRPDGTLWLNMGDIYSESSMTGGKKSKEGTDKRAARMFKGHRRNTGLRPKNMVGLPWRMAFALQDAGWYLRSDIIWHKLNPMPESCPDRPSKAHEYLFLMSKRRNYYYDAAAIQEPIQESTLIRLGQGGFEGQTGGPKDPKDGNRSMRHAMENLREKYSKQGVWEDRHNWEGLTRNRRTVWSLASQPYPGAHFATFPEELVEPCILAGCPPGGLVLDPFAGSGTTLLVALKLSRRAVGIELKPDYAELATRRLQAKLGLFTQRIET